jgi:hypothetical protein
VLTAFYFHFNTCVYLGRSRFEYPAVVLNILSFYYCFTPGVSNHSLAIDTTVIVGLFACCLREVTAYYREAFFETAVKLREES